ncbi:MFS transporter [Cuniculiplasma sp. SKW4]|uniref:MFS transporter n=1 Tax=Cuniculiplasma sp. SKW4 TaxID=3400171 RepID=UPI003FD57A31
MIRATKHPKTTEISIKNFRNISERKIYLMWLGITLCRTSSFVFNLYFMWIIVVQYNSVLLSTLVPTLSLLGYVIISLPEGIILDKLNSSYVGFIATIILIFTYSALFFKNTLTVIYIVDILASILTAILFDAFIKSSREIADESEDSKISALNQIGSSLSNVLGIIMAGIILISASKYLMYILIALSLIGLFSGKPFKIDKIQEKKYIKGEVESALKILVPVMILALLLNGLFVSLMIFGPDIIHIILHRGSNAFTLFELGIPLGTLLGGIVAAEMERKLENALIMFLSVLSMGILLLIISGSVSLYVDISAMFIIGILTSFIEVPSFTIILRIVPREIIGRVDAVVFLVFTASAPVMATIFTLLTPFVPVSTLLTYAGIVACILPIPSYFIMKKFVSLRPMEFIET